MCAECREFCMIQIQFTSFPDERPQGTQSVPINKADMSKAHPKSGLLQLDWNTNGTLLMARFGKNEFHLHVIGHDL